MKTKLLLLLLSLTLSGCTTFQGFKGSATVSHDSGASVTIGYQK